MNDPLPNPGLPNLDGRHLWVTGAGGLLGSYFCRSLASKFPASRLVSMTRDALDLTDFQAVEKQFQRDEPALVIHCAAMSRSPECQEHPAKARLANVLVTQTLAGLSREIPFVFFSTDLVFDGQCGNYDETAIPNPQSYYAESKLAAEGMVRPNPRHLVIRTSLIAGRSPTGDRAFNEQMRSAWARGLVTRLFTDEFRSPIHAQELVSATLALLAAPERGLYHVAGAGRISRFALGTLLAQKCPELHARFEPGSIADFKGPPRPPDTSLNCARAQRFLPFQLSSLPEFLAKHPEAFF